MSNQERFEEVKAMCIENLGEPYFQTDSNILFCGDCLDMLLKLPKGFISTIVTSPPYNIGKEYEQNKSISDYINWSTDWISSACDILRDDGSFLFNIGYIALEDVGRAIPISYLLWDKIPLYLNQEIVWNYSAGVACKNYLSPRNEKILWYVKNKDDYTFNLDAIRDPNVLYPNSKKNGRLRVNTIGKNPSDVWEIAKVTTGANRSSKERTPHPCQFPLDLIDRLVLGFSNEADIILDPFVGSGTTFVSAMKHKRYSIGFEIKEEYCEIAKKRIQLELEASYQLLL